MVKLVNNKNDYRNLLGSSLGDRIKAFTKDDTLAYNCKKILKKSLFSHAEIVYIINNIKINSEQLYNLLLELKDNDIIGYFYKFTYNDKYYVLQLVDKIQDKKKATLELFKLGLMDFSDISEYLSYYDEKTLYEYVSYAITVANKSPFFNINMTDILEYAFMNGYDSVFDLFVSSQNVFDISYFQYFDTEMKLKWIDTYFKLYGPKKEYIEYFNFNFFQRADDLILSDEYYEYLLDAYVNYYHLNEENFNKLFYMYNYCAVKYCSYKNFQKFVNMPSDKLDKVLDLFTIENTTLDLDALNTISNSFLQREFRIKNNEICNYFDYFEEIINNPFYHAESLKHFIGRMLFDFPSLQKYFKNYNLDDFVIELKNGNKEYLNIIHECVQDYIRFHREKYVQDNLKNFYDDLEIDKIVERNWWKKDYIYNTPLNEVLSDFKELVKDEKLSKYKSFVYSNSFTRIHKFKYNYRNVTLTDDEKKMLKDYEYLLNELYEIKKYDYKVNYDTKVIYLPGHASNYDMLDIICEINPKCVINNVLDNDELYDKLYKYLNKYRFLGWSKTFNYVFGRCDIDFGPSTVGCLINYFNKINREIEKGSSLTETIDYCDCYDAKSKKYAVLFGREDYKLIVANAGNYRASRSKVYRIENCKKLLLDAYRKQYISVPPIDKNYVTDTNKTINVVIGNSTNPMNLTYGERTSACLRCGGIFNDLFEFCIRNKNGFHIRFSDPITGKFISRVSGIRNGNTLFLNELRNSKHEEYSNDDLYDCLNKVADDIVSISSKSKYPIENVIITSDYALKGYENLSVPNNIENTHDAFFGMRFNLNPNGKCIKLYPKGKDLNYTFLEDTVDYRTQRDKIIKYENMIKASAAIARIEMIDKLLSGIDIKMISDHVKYDIREAYVGEDWYVYIDNNDEIHTYIMNNSINKDRAQEEINMLNLEMDRGLK